MLTQAEIREQHAIAERKCADFEEIITEIVYAGFEGEKPFPVIMTRDEIIDFVRIRFGELFVGFCRQLPQFILY
jgi:hypothetical protein